MSGEGSASLDPLPNLSRCHPERSESTAETQSKDLVFPAGQPGRRGEFPTLLTILKY
jgi:hypothetical protein